MSATRQLAGVSRSSREKRGYLMSVGFSVPAFGIYGHRYFPVRKYHPLQKRRFLGVQIVWTSYKRSATV